MCVRPRGVCFVLSSHTQVRPDIFPGGGDAALAKFHAESGWPIIGHNRFWSNDSPYAEANGGDFAFSANATSKEYIVPLEQR